MAVVGSRIAVADGCLEAQIAGVGGFVVCRVGRGGGRGGWFGVGELPGQWEMEHTCF